MGYPPHKGQSLLHFPKKKTSRFFVIVCGRGYGKTFASAKEASFVASLPNKKVALVGLSYKKSKLLFDEIWRTMVLPNKNDVVKCSEKDQYVRLNGEVVLKDFRQIIQIRLLVMNMIL